MPVAVATVPPGFISEGYTLPTARPQTSARSRGLPAQPSRRAVYDSALHLPPAPSACTFLLHSRVTLLAAASIAPRPDFDKFTHLPTNSTCSGSSLLHDFTLNCISFSHTTVASSVLTVARSGVPWAASRDETSVARAPSVCTMRACPPVCQCKTHGWRLIVGSFDAAWLALLFRLRDF